MQNEDEETPVSLIRSVCRLQYGLVVRNNMLGLRKFLASLDDLPAEQPIEPELKTTQNKEKDREIKCVCRCCTAAGGKQDRDSSSYAPTSVAAVFAGSSRTCGQELCCRLWYSKGRAMPHPRMATW